MGINKAGVDSTYLVLPSTLGRNKTVILGYLKEHMRQKIQKWEGKYVSKGGKEVLIKSVAQSLPSYAMNVFLLPIKMCKEMEQLMCKYWWSSGSKNCRGIHRKGWKKLIVHKSNGGMRFRNLREFNLCLLGKQGWRLQSQPDSLRSVIEAREVVRMGARERVGNGEETNIINDPWLPCEDNPRVTTVRPSLVGKNVSALS
ncbi:putative mitochondrial protein AtMg00310 [Apium graveolens]|uniref:putative mitochondrial protein AtMg00310 n=1 Tax=Apium graveolens TaxID=4045 RepID=UPI003D796204